MTEKIEKIIKEILEKGVAKNAVFSVEKPEDQENGDLFTNVALVCSKILKKKPQDVAEALVKEILDKKPEYIRDIAIAGPGFINFFFDRKYFSQILKQASENSSFGFSDNLKGEKIMVEYTDPNPFKEFHIGHLMSNTIGESISRMFEAQGAEVKRACYQGDVGLHVAKAIWGMLSVPDRDDSPLKKLSLEAQARYLGHAYAIGASAYEDGKKDEIDAINKKIYERSDSEINRLYDWGRKVSLEYFETQYKRLGTKFDFYFFESEMARPGLEIVREFLKKGIFEESDDAVVFRGERFNPKLHTRVYITSQGIPTYETKELGLHAAKAKGYPADRSIVVTANEQDGVFSVGLEALRQINKELAEKVTHISHGVLRLPSGKMSSRKGEVVTADSLISQVSSVVKNKIADRGYKEEERESITEQVGVAAVRYSILKQSMGSDIIFDFDKSISFEGDSGPYLQYAATRAGSVLRKASEAGIEPKADENLASLEKISDVEKLIAYFPETIDRASKELSPNLIAGYLIELSGAFNRYYGERQIADASIESAPYRVALTKAFQNVMTNGLWLLGIKVPERM